MGMDPQGGAMSISRKLSSEHMSVNLHGGVYKLYHTVRE